jgi:hypothetical protein
MNLKSTSVFAGLIAGSALALSTLPAQAFTLNPNGSITFAAPETLEFTFLESRGFYQSSFGVYSAPNANALVTTLFTENSPGFDPGSSDLNGDWLGTQGETVNPFITSFTFDPGTYFFGLDSRPQGGTTFTTASGTFDAGVAGLGNPFVPSGGSNPANVVSNPEDPLSAFNSTSPIYYRSTVGPGAIANGVNPNFQPLDTSRFSFFTAINDTDTIDGDVQDFIVGVRSTTTTVPEPATLAGLGLVAGAMTMLRRRKGSQPS